MQNGQPENLGERTKRFAVRVIKLYVSLTNKPEMQVIGKQVLRSGTSIGAQYREAMRARSVAEFSSKMQSALQEIEETCYWLELFVDADLLPSQRLDPLQSEADELRRIFIASINTAKRRKARADK